MPKNLNGQQAGVVHGDQVNDPSVRVIKGKNQFPQSFHHPSSCRYGEVDPVAAIRCERGDVIPYKFVTDLDTFTMASPMRSKVNQYAAAFKVPMQAIYPRNWELMYTNPVQGDDVPEDTRALFDPIRLDTTLNEFIRESVQKGNDFYPIYVRLILLKELLFSSGSLFSKFNMHFDSWKLNVIKATSPQTVESRMYFDDWFDTVFAPWLKQAFADSLEFAEVDHTPNFYHLMTHDEENRQYYIVVPDGSDLVGESAVNWTGRYITFRRALELLRTGEYEVNFGDYDFGSNQMTYTSTGLSFYEDVNIEPIIAYQLCCAHFFTNSKVDFIYTAQLWRDNMESLIWGDILPGFGSTVIPNYEYNGTLRLYDIMSKRTFFAMSDPNEYPSTLLEHLYYARTSFWFNLFSYQRSLRYADYFTGAHPQPLAVGDIDAPVIDGKVNAIDMTKKLQLTRYLNKVNISGPRFQDYLLALFGGKIPEAPKDVPVRLSVEKFDVSGFEVNNTGEAQQSPDNPVISTTNLRLSDSRYMFEANIDEPCWIIAVQYFDAQRIYSRTMDRFAFHKNRFDDFIPDLQFIGDQPIYQRELDITLGYPDMPYAYNLRYMEYKNRYSYASGLYSRKLKSWALVTDNNDGNPSVNNISPEYIRSSPSEFDRFYKSLTGYSLGTYAHFITFTTNVVSPYRQMVYAPEILA